MTRIKLALAIVILIIIQFALLYIFVKTATSNLHLLAVDNTPACVNDLTPSDCSLIASGITLDMLNNVTVVNGSILVAAFIAYLGTGDESLINCSPYTLVTWSGDELPIAIIYTNYKIVIFRGSMTAADFSTDFQFTEQVAINNIMIHKGFNDLYKAIQSQFVDILHSQLTILGHSLGCALALLLAYNCTSSDITIFNYAPPKVGNTAFATYMNKYAITSVINSADIIPTLPLSYMLNAGKVYQYAHCGKCITFNDAATDLISCHSMTVYVRNMHY